MPSYNKVILIGHLTREPESRMQPSGNAVIGFGLAINRKYKTSSGEQGEETCFVDVSAFGKTAENIQRFFHKGDAIMIEGRLRYDQWEDKDGNRRSKVCVVADTFNFVGGGKGNGGGGQHQSQGQNWGQQQNYDPPGGQQGPPGGGYQQGYSQPHNQVQGVYSNAPEQQNQASGWGQDTPF